MTRTETPAQLVDRAAELTTQAARGQYAAIPDHRDLYSLLMAAERALDALHAVNSNVGAQTAHYGEGRRLRTDTDRGPAEVLAAAMDHGRALDAALWQARQAARSMAGEFARLAHQPDPDEPADGEDADEWLR